MRSSRTPTCQVIPAIDVLDGRIVRLRQGDFANVTDYGNDPLAMARRYERAGTKRLHLVNLSGTKAGGMDVNFLATLREISEETRLQIQAGAGLRTLQDIQAVLDAGAAKAVLGTAVFKNPAMVKAAVTLFGMNRFVAALDVKNGGIRIQGWRQKSGFDLWSACRLVSKIGIREILVTDIARDGMKRGPNVDLYENIRAAFPLLRLIASGGVRDMNDIDALAAISVDATVVGKALLDGSLPLAALKMNTKSNREDSQSSIRPASTLAVRVIPCLDIAGGRVVKGTRFQNLRDAGDPVTLAKHYCEEGADELVLLDIEAGAENRETAFALASRVADVVNIPFTIGGGIRTVEDARRILDAGADKVAINSAGVRNPALFSQMAAEMGRANTVCAIDARRKGSGWTVLLNGGSVDAEIDAIEWAKRVTKLGAGELLVTSYDRDGTGDGFDTELLSKMKSTVSVPVIASGGAGTLSSFTDAVRLGRADAVLAASVFHFGTFSIRDVKQALATSSFPVRL